MNQRCQMAGSGGEWVRESAEMCMSWASSFIDTNHKRRWNTLTSDENGVIQCGQTFGLDLQTWSAKGSTLSEGQDGAGPERLRGSDTHRAGGAVWKAWWGAFKSISLAGRELLGEHVSMFGPDCGGPESAVTCKWGLHPWLFALSNACLLLHLVELLSKITLLSIFS